MSDSIIEKLILEKNDGQKFDYEFSKGVNYFQGKNGSGKTEFFYFLDYMLGSESIKLDGKEWYQELKKATLVYAKNDTRYYFTRYKEASKNYFHINDEPDEKCTLEQYKLFLSVVVTDENSSNLQELRNITNTDLSIRSCSAFNFLEETGILSNPKTNFLTKCRDYKYQKWTSIILDYLFHPNSAEIYKKRKEILELKNKLKEQQDLVNKLNIYKTSINEALKELNSSQEFKNNSDVIRKEISRIKNFNNVGGIPNLETVYQLNNVTERIKLIKNSTKDMESINKSAKNRIDMINRLGALIENTPEYEQLANPIIELLNDLSNTINFSDLLIKNRNKENLEIVKNKLQKSAKLRSSNSEIIEIDKKIQLISVIEDLLNRYDIEYQEIDIEDTITRLETAEKDLDRLINTVDQEKIKQFQKIVIDLYKSASSVSPLILSDLTHEGFIFDYDEKHNYIIPSMIVYDEDDTLSEIHIEQYRGSQARSSIIQLCGYCALQILLQKDNTIPCMPILVIDHFSKTFSDDNLKALGSILNKFYEIMNDDNFQVFIFEIKEANDLNLFNYKEYKLVTDSKSGFIPWINENN